MSDAEKLRTLAQWFDVEQAKGRWKSNSTEVQDDLRRIADRLDKDDAMRKADGKERRT